MGTTERTTFLGAGIYTASQAGRLTNVASARVTRWMRGYEYAGRDGRRREVPPILQWDATAPDGTLQLTFRDLIEIRFVDAFLKFGVSWKELRLAAGHAAQLLQTTHPFSTVKFKTDGRRIFTRLQDAAGDAHLVQLRDNQLVFASVVEPALIGVEFDRESAVRWRPLGERKRVVIDPARSFGQPIGEKSGIRAEVLAGQVAATSIRAAASWFGVDPAEVKDAVEFCDRFAA